MKRSTLPAIQRFPIFLEALEDRIAPAAINESGIVSAVAGSTILLKAGEGLGTSGAYAGEYFLYVEKGQALVFTTDLNGDGIINSDEITGIAAGDGLRLLSFVNINGDIVTNLNPDGTLTDSDGDPSNGRDGEILLNSRIESITFRSITEADINTSIVGNTVHNRLSVSNYSLYGNIYAGGGVGGNGGTGITIDTAGFDGQAAKYNMGNYWFDGVPTPSIGAIYTGTAANGKVFSFGTSPIYGDGVNQSIRGTLSDFVPAAGQAGGDVIGIRAGKTSDGVFTPVAFHISGVQTGDGGFGAKGGNIQDVHLYGDVGTFFAIAGNGGDGVSGGNGGSISGFSITASPNSVVTITTGSGGMGLIGTAGQAGNFTAGGVIEVYGNVTVGLGNGGDALGNAGAGTSLSNATFTLFDVGEAMPANFVSSMRAPGDLGSSRTFDMDGDGNPDAVFLTQNTQQLAVAFGNGEGGYSAYFILDPANYADPEVRSSPLVVGDFNGDGLPDIATASSLGTGFGGIKVYLNQGNADDGTWLGFGDAQYSPSPLAEYGVNVALVAGDFDGDGITDLALMNQSKSLAQPYYYGNLVIMSGLTGKDGTTPDGFFAANYGLGSGNLPTLYPVLPAAISFKGTTEIAFTMQATAIEQGVVDTPEIIAVLTRTAGDDNPTLFKTFIFESSQLQQVSSTTIKFSPRTIEEIEVGGVSSKYLVYEDAEIINGYAFAIADADGDGIFDPVIFGEYANFTVASVLKGDVDGSVTEQFLADTRTNSPQPYPTGVKYYGIALTAPTATTSESQIPRVLNSDKLNSIYSAIEVKVDGTTNQIAYGAMIPNANGKLIAHVMTFNLVGFGQYGASGASDGALVSVSDKTGFTPIGSDTTRNMFFGINPDAASGYSGMIKPDGKPWNLAGKLLISNSLALLAGNGGFSYLGNGGAGGSLGSGSASLLNGTLTGSIVVTDFATATYQAGAGGSGFLNGGKAGTLAGIATKGINNTLATFSGGGGLLGNGGNGGSISGIYYQGVNTQTQQATLNLLTGDGGIGLRGGNGGIISGKGDEAFPDLQTSLLFAQTGDGAFGMTKGGNGGNISNFRPEMAVRGQEWLWSSELTYYAGDGGNSAAGIGGTGGGILSSGPTPDYNLLYSDVMLMSGNGGHGLTGGAGGAITNFENRVTGGSTPDYVEVLAGHGGNGVTGNGGAGGSISKLQLTSSGDILPVIAGNGGMSSGAIGGIGGSIFNTLELAAKNGSVIIAAGTGGLGFTAGGAGGNLTNTKGLTSSGLNNGRVIAIAGDGGNAVSVNLATIQKENPMPIGANPATWALFQQVWTMGLQSGRGGNGGSINGLTQTGNIQVSTDLIAGNGGSTINHGTVSDRTTSVGRGGSITNISLRGDAGIIDQTVAIRSYVPYGESMSSFVSDVRDGSVTSIDQTTGNVGVVVGNSGYVRGGLPSSAGVAGSVSNFEARNIMSMVAGSVDRIAAIVSVTGVKLNGGSIIGAYKNGTAAIPSVPHINGNAYYSDPNYTGTVQNNARPGGSLVDGAVLTYKYSGPNGRVFDL